LYRRGVAGVGGDWRGSDAGERRLERAEEHQEVWLELVDVPISADLGCLVKLPMMPFRCLTAVAISLACRVARARRPRRAVVSLRVRPVVVAPAPTCSRALPVVTVERPGHVARSSHRTLLLPDFLPGRRVSPSPTHRS
jgi:hypothetical protein